MSDINIPNPAYQLTLGNRLVLAVAKKWDSSAKLCFVYLLRSELGKCFNYGFDPEADMQIFTFTTLKEGNVFYYTWKEALNYSKTYEKMYEKCVARNAKRLKKFDEIVKQK